MDLLFFLQFYRPLKVWRDSKDQLCIQLADKSDVADQSCRADFAPHKNVLRRRKVANERTYGAACAVCFRSRRFGWTGLRWLAFKTLYSELSGFYLSVLSINFLLFLIESSCIEVKLSKSDQLVSGNNQLISALTG